LTIKINLTYDNDFVDDVDVYPYTRLESSEELVQENRL